MDRKRFEGERWKLCYGAYEDIEGYAVDELYKAVQQYIPYTLTVQPSDRDLDIDCNLLIIGTLHTNHVLEKLAAEGLIAPPDDPQGFDIRVMVSPWHPERQVALLSGTHAAGVLYAVRDFVHDLVEPARHGSQAVYNTPAKIFLEKLPEFRRISAPAITNRGVWTWGHVVFDYRGLLEHMSQWKLNMLTLWNDYAPLNAREIVKYAQQRGIQVVWGFTWCWGEEVDPTNPDHLQYWTERVIQTYEEQYAGIGANAIYFQTFTEHSGPLINGKSAADLSVDWVNQIAGKLLERHPELEIQFGLHAEHVKRDFEAYRRIDKRLAIIWEDAGSFPFYHEPDRIDDFGQTLAFSQNIAGLRGADERCGAVFKGMTMLSWPDFEHQKGPFILGEASAAFKHQRSAEKEFRWKHVQSRWIRNMTLLQKMVMAIKSDNAKQTSIAMLVEDGLFDERLWGPVALFAEALWNPEAGSDTLVDKVLSSSDAIFL